MIPSAEYVSGVPSGLIACRVDGIQAHIMGISPRCVDLRTPDPLPEAVPVQLYFYRPEQGGYLCMPVKNIQTGEARREQGAALTRLFFDDPACAAAVRRSLNDYARYAEIRSTRGASAYGQAVSGYPAHLDDEFHASPEDQFRAWFENMQPLSKMPDGCALAVSLNCRDLCALYLSRPLADFMDGYARLRGVPRRILPDRTPDRLYIGNAYCGFLLPEAAELRAITEKAAREGLGITIVTASLRAGEEDRADAILRLCADLGAEIEIGDWGMLHRAQAFRGRIAILLGTRLNRRRKDPRMAWKSGLGDREELLSQNSLNDPGWLTFLRELGVERCEYESCGLNTDLPDLPCSLHLPFYQTNSSAWCPIAAICARGGRGDQRAMASCPRWCENNLLLYPAHLKMLGRFNSLLALDDHAGERAHGYDRWVLNF